jgi:protein-disulfide isomerase
MSHVTDPAASLPDPADEPGAAGSPEPVASEPAESALATVPADPVPADPVPTVPVVAYTPPSGGSGSGRGIAIGVMLAVVVAFGGGILVGRATAPAAEPDTASVASPAPSDGSPAPSDGSPSPSLPTPVPSTPSAGLPFEGNRLGRADAKVVVDYWADYQCPFCSKFAEETIPVLRPLIEDGTVALVHRDFAFLGPESFDAAMAVRCAGREDRYWAMHDAVYAAQQGENQGAFSRPRLADVAASIGLDGDAFAACMDDVDVLVGVLDDNAAAGRAVIDSTPTIDVNGQRFNGVPDPAKLIAAIEAAAGGAAPGVLPTPQPLPDDWSAITTDGREAGDPDAPVTVQLWMDYQAPDAPVIADALGPELRARIAKGGVRAELRDLATLGDESVVAAAAVRCVAEQGGPTWLVHDAVSSAAAGAGQGIFTRENLARFTSRLFLDVAALDACLQRPDIATAVGAETETGKALGLTAGPVVIVRKGDREVARFEGDLDVTKILAAIKKAGQ